MIVVHSFIGSFPAYTVDCVEQTRRFYDGPIYLIVSDMAHPSLLRLQTEFQVILVPYEEVISYDFNEIATANDHKFMKCPDLKGREQLFLRTYERYFLLYRLMIAHGLSNVLFMEVDNLLYADPREWESEMEKYALAYMYDNTSRCGAGIAFIRDAESLLQLNQYMAAEIAETNEPLIHEMRTLHNYWNTYPDRVQMLPTAPAQPMYPLAIYENIIRYGETLFDVAGMGIYLGGLDPHHTEGVIQKGRRAPWSLVDYTPYTFDWREDAKGRRIPYLLAPNGQWLRINNLHIHSKALRDCM